ncbi:hypothetical protein BCR44DRAFT_1516683 [Catenaria anguillulae PL171]|uniref:Uncharacterized protein n=1 Tax=Catenaria anguillulae PL171 TaxID=765915 RepID=A0A1Y2H854_9FUNG|nr:hypothetical protein BCR44DRAFT_1516683 [Catenaria anguillulae PL171]
MQQTPILQTYQVWDLAALVLAAATFPLCLLPLRLIRKDYNRASSSRQLRRNHLLLLILWIAITASHTLLILFPIVGFFEQVCEDGTPMSLDTANQFLKRCKRSYINTLVEAMEVLTLPAYPALMVSTYLQLLPTTVPAPALYRAANSSR